MGGTTRTGQQSNENRRHLLAASLSGRNMLAIALANKLARIAWAVRPSKIERPDEGGRRTSMALPSDPQEAPQRWRAPLLVVKANAPPVAWAAAQFLRPIRASGRFRIDSLFGSSMVC
jgi:hypothetical protein